MRAMVVIVPQQCGPAGVMHVPVSVPRIACPIDHVKYLEPSDVKPLTDATERRRYRHRGPTLRSLVKQAVTCDNAEQLGQQLRGSTGHWRWIEKRRSVTAR